MSKTKNRKRSKMLHQRKKAKERKIIEEKAHINGLSKIKRRLKKELNTDVIFNHNNNKSNDRKISCVINEMIQPLMEEARTFDEEKDFISLGVMACNLGVIKQYKGEKEVNKSLKDIEMSLPKEIKDLIVEYCNIKCENYSSYDEFIVDYEFTKLNDKQNNLTVSYKSVNE